MSHSVIKGKKLEKYEKQKMANDDDFPTRFLESCVWHFCFCYKKAKKKNEKCVFSTWHKKHSLNSITDCMNTFIF